MHKIDKYIEAFEEAGNIGNGAFVVPPQNDLDKCLMKEYLQNKKEKASQKG
ncbi:hypothetical protein [Paenibacillus sp. USHLN196]|jgi:hypothetical protein|uniref:hypothetical protein n=1 Tax=Paenibacillus sp. USHLN196 TaxID=3081291 RepID=UPI00301B224A